MRSDGQTIKFHYWKLKKNTKVVCSLPSECRDGLSGSNTNNKRGIHFNRSSDIKKKTLAVSI